MADPIDNSQGEIELIKPLERVHCIPRQHDLGAKPLQR